MKGTVTKTANRESYVELSKLKSTADFFKYQKKVNTKPEDVASHKVIVDHINQFGEDYRFETKPNPVDELKDRTTDNISLGRVTK